MNRSADGRLLITGGDKIIITKSQFSELKKIVTNIRTKIVQDEI